MLKSIAPPTVHHGALKTSRLFAAAQLFAALYCSSSMGDTFSGTVQVNIVEAISIIEQQQVNFGVLLNEVGVCNMTATGFTSGTIFSCNGNETEGIFTVSGTTGSTLNLAVTPGTANDITFTPSLPNGSTVVLSGGGSSSSAQVIVAGSLSVGVGATDGVTQIPFTLTADYN